MRMFAAVLLTATTVNAQSLQPADWDAPITLVEAEDTNPDPRIVEITLEARTQSREIAPGVRTDAWTYNGGLPGPLIRARRGDRLIVHFSNKLPEPTTVHWHGVQVPIEMDGVPGASQPPVENGQSFTYDFIVPEPDMAPSAGKVAEIRELAAGGEIGCFMTEPQFAPDLLVQLAGDYNLPVIEIDPSGVVVTEVPSSSELININTASQAELETLPGIGPTTAQKIIEYREANGSFLSTEDIVNVSGIGPVTYERIKDLITVGP